MADYRQGCGCWTTHTYPCKQAADYEFRKKQEHIKRQREALGFTHMEGDLWACRRGCGTVVWDVVAHIQNVCRESVDNAT